MPSSQILPQKENRSYLLLIEDGSQVLNAHGASLGLGSVVVPHMCFIALRAVTHTIPRQCVSFVKSTMNIA